MPRSTGSLLTALFLLLSTVAGSASARAAAPEEDASATRGAWAPVEIDEINLIDITVFSQSDLEKVLEISPGERLEKAKVIATAKNIQDLYASHGYESVQIRTRILQRPNASQRRNENVLEISVKEGLPTRVARIRLQFDQPGLAGEYGSLVTRLGLQPGDVYDQEKLANGYRALQDSFTSADFMGVKVDEAIVNVSTATAGPPSIAARTARWVELVIPISLGERVSFGFRGNQVYSVPKLLALVEEQRLLGFSKDYLSRIQARISDEYRKLGYDRVQIKLYTFENERQQRRHVTFEIQEGERVTIEAVEFDGNLVFQSEQLREKFFEVAAPIVQREYYVATQIEKAAELVVEWIKSQGYLFAKVVSVTRTYRAENDRVRVLVSIYEGEQTLTETIQLKGLTVFTSEEAQRLLGVKEGTPLNLYAFNEGIESFKAAYRARGYLDIRILNEGQSSVIHYAEENRVAEITLELDEGPQYRVGTVEIQGLNRTVPDVVLRELQLSRGQVLEEPKLFESEARLRRLGIFGSAAIQLVEDPADKTIKNLKIVIEEGTPGLLATGIGLRNDLGGRIFGQVAYSDLWGKNHTLSLTGYANRRFRRFGADFCASDKQRSDDPLSDHCFLEYDLQLGYVWPYFAFGDAFLRPRITFDRTQFIKFDANTAAFTVSLEKQLLRRPNLVGVLTYSLESTEQFNANQELDNQRIRIGAVTPSMILDLRDNPLSPTRGFYATASYEVALSQFGSQADPYPVSYTRFQYRNDYHLPLPKGVGAYFSFRTGLEYNMAKPPENDPNNPLYAIPLIKQFTLGGVSSLRGFREQGLFIPETIAVRGYASYVNYRAQIDLPFTGNLRFGPFLDAANLNVDKFSWGGLRYGAGGGFHYRSPVGPVNFDVGFNLKPRAGEDAYKLHFSIGVI